MKNRLRVSIGYSIVIHLILLCFLKFWDTRDRQKESEKNPYLIVELDRTDRNKIVRSHEGEKVEEAPKDAYLSDQNRRVKEEKVSQAKELQAQKPPPPGGAAQKNVSIPSLGVPLFKNLPKEKSGPQNENWAEQGQYVEDYVPGVEESERTALNTKEFVYFSYFQRVRSQLDTAWRPILRTYVMKMYRRGEMLKRKRDHTTKTLVTLNRKGRIVRIQVMKESGVIDLDRAAVDAFNRAGPFPNPPTGLVEANGSVVLRWDFILRT